MTEGNKRCWLHLREAVSQAVNILHFLDRRERVLSDEFFEFIPMGLFKIEGWGSSIGITKGSKLGSDVDGEVIGTQTWESVPFTCGS